MSTQARRRKPLSKSAEDSDESVKTPESQSNYNQHLHDNDNQLGQSNGEYSDPAAMTAGEEPYVVIQLSRTTVNTIIAMSVIICTLGFVGLAVWFSVDDHFRGDPLVFRMMGPEAFALFRQHDYNNDGVLEPREFEPLAHVLVETNITWTYDLPISLEDNMVTLTSHLDPLNISTMSLVSKNIRTEGDIHEEKPLKGLLAWKAPAIDIQNMAVSYFAAFLPKDFDNAELPALGKPYHLTPYSARPDADMEDRLARSSSNRFYPPRVAGKVITLHNLLAMFHSRPFVNIRFPPQGALACLRAYNDVWLDITFRIHAEFQLNEPPQLPFWFTPAQFKGRLIISRDLNRILYFNMLVPPNRRLNVDMEWLKGEAETEMEVDIGYMPRMELRATGPSRPAVWEGQDMRELHKPETESAEQVLEDLTWSQEVQVDVCTRAMEVEFYPFQKVPYYNYTEAYEVAEKEKKLIHSIVLWGALDDQSC